MCTAIFNQGFFRSSVAQAEQRLPAPNRQSANNAELRVGWWPLALPGFDAANYFPPTRPTTSCWGGRGYRPSWFEAQDLAAINAWGNEIAETQPEMPTPGSLKTADVGAYPYFLSCVILMAGILYDEQLHKNKQITWLAGFANPSAPTSLGLYQNAPTPLRTYALAPPNPVAPNKACHAITALPFSAPFSSGPVRSHQSTARSSFAPVVEHAPIPLPKLQAPNASHCQLTAAAIDHVGTCPLAMPPELGLSANLLGA
jgi:hypothetical protein